MAEDTEGFPEVDNPVAKGGTGDDASDIDAFGKATTQGDVNRTATNHIVGKPYKSPASCPSRLQDGAQSWEEHQQELLDNINLLFDDIDTDNDGMLSKEELMNKIELDGQLVQLMRLAGKSTAGIERQLENTTAANDETTRTDSSSQATSIQDQMDTDNDGFVSREEFVRMLAAPTFSYTIEWLEEQIVFNAVKSRQRKLNCRLDGTDLGTVIPCWALLFEVEEGEDGLPSNIITHETVEVVQKCWALDLSVDMRRTLDRGEVIILIGIPHVKMCQEAEEMEMRMRLKATRGTFEYALECHEVYAGFLRHTPDSHGDLFLEGTKDFAGEPYFATFLSAHQQQATLSCLKRGGMDLDFRTRLPPALDLVKRTEKALKHGKPIRAFELKRLLTAAGGFRERCELTMGEGIAMLAKQVMADPFFTIYDDEDLEGDKKSDRLAQQQQENYASHMREAMMDPFSYKDVTKIADELSRWLEPGVLEKQNGDGKIVREAMPAGPGLNERFVGSLLMIFPVHNDEELEWLRVNWGKPSLCFALSTMALPVEGANTLAIGHPHYVVQNHRWGFLYQPIDQIRDYLGDDTALYFSWLGTYTRALMSASFFGIVTMANQTDGVDNNELTVYYSIFLSCWSVLFLSMWKRQEAEHAFLWGSKGFEETEEPRPEFKGVLVINSETGKEDLVYGPSLPRLMKKLFSTVIISACMLITVGLALTASSLKYRAPKLCSTKFNVEKSMIGDELCGIADQEQLFELDCCFCISDAECPGYNSGGVVSSGVVGNLSGIVGNSSSIGMTNNVEADEEKWDSLSFTDKFGWPLTSSVLNLFIIVTAGLVYEGIASWLNDLENFRTKTAYDDGEIVKNFM